MQYGNEKLLLRNKTVDTSNEQQAVAVIAPVEVPKQSLAERTKKILDEMEE